jgi:hypothetical protein
MAKKKLEEADVGIICVTTFAIKKLIFVAIVQKDCSYDGRRKVKEKPNG